MINYVYKIDNLEVVIHLVNDYSLYQFLKEVGISKTTR